MIPLIAEVILLALGSFALGFGAAYLLELRRKARANWRW